MDKIDTATQTLELFARRIATKQPYKHPLQLACEDHGIGDLVIFLGQGDYPTMAGLADKARDDFDCAAAVILALAAERDAARAREAELQAEVDRLREALQALHHAVCGETGFAKAVRLNSGLAYPWPTLDISDEMARAALNPTGDTGA